LETQYDSQSGTVLQEFIRRDTYDQWRNFGLLEYYLMHPRSLRTQTLFQLDDTLQLELLKRYYSLDDDFVRELLGRRLRRRMRKELEEIAEHVKVKLKSAMRQFNNLLRVKKRLQSLQRRTTNTIISTTNATNSLSSLIQHHFLIDRELASKYIRIVFLLYHRLDVRKRLNVLSYAEIDALVNILMCKWIGTANGEAANSSSEVPTLTLDSKFLTALRDLKNLFNDRIYLSLYKKNVKLALERINEGAVTHKIPNPRYTSLLKTLITLGAGLGQAKEFKDFFVDVVDKIGQPLKQLNFTRTDMRSLCDVLVQSFSSFLDTHAHSSELQGQTVTYLFAWTRFLQALRDCLTIVYDYF
jgi:hypothetical protein